MIFWSIIPVETAFSGFDDPDQQPELHTIEWQGVTMVVEMVQPMQLKIHRLISPNALDYLKPEWMPGQMLNLLS